MHRQPAARWRALCDCPAVFIVGRERAKLGYFWRHSYRISKSGRFQGCRGQSGHRPTYHRRRERLSLTEFKKTRLSEIIGNGNGEEPVVSRDVVRFTSALWQADREKTRRYAPIDFIGRYMQDFFDYAIADEVHELKGENRTRKCSRNTCRLRGPDRDFDRNLARVIRR